MELFVKVQANWRQNSQMVKMLDWHRQLEEMQERQSPDDEEEFEAGADESEDEEAEADEK
jgi:hypothetical protein